MINYLSLIINYLRRVLDPKRLVRYMVEHLLNIALHKLVFVVGTNFHTDLPCIECLLQVLDTVF